MPATSALLVVQGGQVVGVTRGDSGSDIPLQPGGAAGQPAQALPRSLRLEGCDTGSTRLPAGDYQVVAVLGYRLDPLNGAPADGVATGQPGGSRFALVSAPAPITITIT